MTRSDLIVCSIATREGLVTSTQLARAVLEQSPGDGDSLAERLERIGALTPGQRASLEERAKIALHTASVSAPVASRTEAFQSLANSPAYSLDSRPNPRLVPVEREGQYTRLEELGRGGQSVVYRAIDEFVGREIALKELTRRDDVAPAPVSGPNVAVSRFLREARLTARLDHPGVVTVHELAIRSDGTLVCAQKLIRGETLKAKLGACRSDGERLALLPHLVNACQAVGYAHSRAIVHRDLKPSNIMVGPFGETVVVDWGLAKSLDELEETTSNAGLPPSEMDLTVAGAKLGTPAYMSPEQARGALGEIDERSDVFSLGAILYEVLSGQPPFVGATREQVLESAGVGTHDPIKALAPDAPPELAAIAERALAFDPDGRYANAEALAKELSAYLAGGRVRAYQYGTWELLRKFASSHRALVAGLAVALGALVLTAVVVAVRLQVARRDLARSFIERAHTAERESDWALAAGYFAAARTQRDTPEARWGVALAQERAPERILSLQGPPDSFTDVGLLSDGRLVVLGTAGHRVEVRELEGGKVLWSREAERVAAAALLPGGQVRLSLPKGWAFFDAATGRELGMFDRETVGRPCPGPFPTPVVLFQGQLIARREGQPPVTLATDVTALDPFCAVSDDGRQVAYRDSSGRVRLVAIDDGRKLGERDGTGARNLLFTSHGLVVVRQGWLDTLGAPEGDFSVALGEPAFTVGQLRLGGAGVSPDGHLVVVARIGSRRADVVDLRTRSVRGTVHYPSGWPRFAFSLDGQRLFAAGSGRGSQFTAWRLPPDESPTGHPGRWTFELVDFSPGGRQMAIVDVAKSTLELYGPAGELLARDPVPTGLNGNEGIRDGVVLLADSEKSQLTLRDVEHHVDLWSHPCRACSDYQVSADGNRLAAVGLDGLEVWDAAANRVLFRETARLIGFDTIVSISADGQRIAWMDGVLGHLRDVASGAERQFSLDGTRGVMRFSPDSKQVAVVTSGSLALWDAVTGRGLWFVPHTTPDRPFDVRWSVDRQSLVVQYSGLGTELFDARTGERLARFLAMGTWASELRPDLRAKLVLSPSNWNMRPVPPPVTAPPAESLARTLQKTGLALDGVELVAVP